MLFDKIFAARQTEATAPRQSFLIPKRSSAGVDMSEDRALMYSAVFSAVKVISETVAMLPWRVYRINGDTQELQTNMRLDRILHRRPNDEMTAFTFREYLVSCALLWGNGYAEIERSGAGGIANLWPIHPSFVTPERDDNGRLVYRVDAENGGQPTYLPARQMYHLKGPTKDGVSGRSMISLARESWGLGIAAEQFGASFFGNGGVPGMVITETEDAPKMSPEGATNMLESFDRRHKGSDKAGRTAYLERGFEIKTIGVPQKDAQFIETRKHQITDVARWFRLPPHKIGDMENATFSNIEQQSIDFVVDSIQPWTERIEQEADVKLHDQNNVITKINLNGLLRGDSAARGQFYNTLWNIGVLSTNQILRLEDMNPIGPEGDQRFVPLNMVTLERANQAGRTDRGGAVRGVLIDAHERMITKECKAIQRAVSADKDLSAWAQDFYQRHEPQMVEALLPGANAAAEHLELDAELMNEQVKEHCRRHVEASMNDLQSDNTWDNRASEGADKLLSRLAGAAQ